MAIFLCYDDPRQPDHGRNIPFLLSWNRSAFFHADSLEKLLTASNRDDIINIVPCEGGGMADAPA